MRDEQTDRRTMKVGGMEWGVGGGGGEELMDSETGG